MKTINAVNSDDKVTFSLTNYQILRLLIAIDKSEYAEDIEDIREIIWDSLPREEIKPQ